MSVSSRTRRRSLRTVAAAMLFTLVGATAATAAPGVGAPGIGDPYYPGYGNRGYDVGHYSIDVGYTPDTGGLTGHTTLHATATQALRRFNLDLVLQASSVLVNGRPATFNQSGDAHELVVTPAVPLRAGESMVVEVRYAGRPAAIRLDGIAPWITTADGAVALGEPEIAAWWYPSNDHPRDKATFDVAITVPRGVEAISNGRLVSKTETGALERWSWTSALPMATYLAFVAIGQFDVTSGTTASGLPWLNAVAEGGGAEGAAAAADLARTPEVVEWLAVQWGPYPFEAVGGVAPKADFGFALETQTRPVYTRGFWANGKPNIEVVVHELAHHWFGNSVSVRNWRDIWLNEGFATFSEFRWAEMHGGATGNQILETLYRDLVADPLFWSLPIGDPGARNEFARPVYVRGAMTLQALRNRVGSAAFFQIMRAWASQHRYGNADTDQFIGLAERRSGQQLDGFFHAWLYARTAPAATRANGLDPGWADGSTPRAARPPVLDRMDARIRSEAAKHQQARL